MTEEYWYWICNIKGIYGSKLKKLLERGGHPRNLYHMNKKEVAGLKVLGEKETEALINSRCEERITEGFKGLAKQGICFYSRENPLYPARLKNLREAPLCLYVKGALPDDGPSVAMVGARDCSAYGRAAALEFGEELARHHVQIVSGLARGIDGYSHQGALNGKGKTFGVLGCGVQICYPKEQYPLWEKMLEQGGIISEYPVWQNPLPVFFPERNRIISGLADIVLVIEAKEKSGSLITADWALEQGKDVFAIPGRICDPLSAGCNKLICQGAGAAISPEEIIKELGLKCEQSEKLIKNHNNLLERKENMVYSCLDFHPKSLEDILACSGLSYTELLTALVELEMKGYITEASKNYYMKTKF